MSLYYDDPSAFVWLTFNILIVASIFFYHRFKRDPILFWSPATLVAGIFIYYIIVGPTVIHLASEPIDRGVDMTPFYGIGWQSAGLSLLCWCIGFYGLAFRQKTEPTPTTGNFRPPLIQSPILWPAGMILCVSGFTLFALARGPSVIELLNPFYGNDSQELEGVGALTNYLTLSINFLIPGCIALWIGRKPGIKCILIFGFWLAIATALFTSLGFRYRLVLLLVGLVYAHYLIKGKRFNLGFAAVLLLVFITFMGQIAATRIYGFGLQKDQILSVREALINGFGESGIFGTSGAVIATVPQYRDFTGFESIKQAILFPIPSGLYPDKNSNQYIVETLVAIYGPQAYVGAAFMFHAEWYLSFGWWGLIIASLIFGVICALLWKWFLRNRYKHLGIFIYAVSAPMIYMFFSRGYLPQVVMITAFSTLPAIILYNISRYITK